MNTAPSAPHAPPSAPLSDRTALEQPVRRARSQILHDPVRNTAARHERVSRIPPARASQIAESAAGLRGPVRVAGNLKRTPLRGSEMI